MSDNLKIIYHDEAQLLDYGESRSTGPWIKLRLADVEQLKEFRGLDTATAKKTGHIFNMTISQGDIIADKSIGEGSFGGEILNMNGAAADVVVSKYGKQAQALRLSSFFRRPDVWAAIGTGEDYHAWVQDQKCVVCGKMDYIANDAEFGGGHKCEAAHVRRAVDSGTGYKADYVEVPLCHNHHALQHNQGELAAYNVYKPNETDLEIAQDFFNKKRIDHVQRWCWETLKEQLCYSSWSDIPPDALLEWAQLNNVSGAGNMWLPRCYDDNAG